MNFKSNNQTADIQSVLWRQALDTYNFQDFQNAADWLDILNASVGTSHDFGSAKDQRGSIDIAPKNTPDVHI